jgi:hypothetical protein
MGMCMPFQRCWTWKSLEDDEFPYSNLMNINVEEASKKFQNIIQYLDDMKFLTWVMKLIHKDKDCAQDLKLFNPW